MKTVIMLAGNAGVGKDTAKNIIIGVLRRENISYEVSSSAKPIYDMVEVLIGRERLEYYKKRENKEKIIPYLGVSLRFLLQTLGTEWGREIIDKNLWVNLVKQKIKNSDKEFFIITDCRYDNEQKMIDSFSKELEDTICKTILLQSSNTIYSTSNKKHKSEQECNSVKHNYLIINNFDREFHTQVRNITEEIIKNNNEVK